MMARTSAALLLLLGSPSAALAQRTVSHASRYTQAAVALPTPGAARPVKSALKLVDPKTLPLAALMRDNAAPAGAAALVAGAITGGTSPAAQTWVPGLRSDAYGEYSPARSIAPYTTAGAYASYGGPTPTVAAVAVSAFPWRATGALYFTIGGDSFACSGSLIAPGLLVTAAHCVFEYGTKSDAGWHSNFYFYPALSDNPIYGYYTAIHEIIPDVYYKGTDHCEVDGVVCNNDIAIIVLRANGGVLPGTRLSWYNYGWNGFSFVKSFGGAWLTHVTQLGYPHAFDGGRRMTRTDGIGAYYGPAGLRNIVLGTAQTGGSSGGPWLANFGAKPSVDPFEATLGRDTLANTVIGVTSWGYDGAGPNAQGASFFGENDWARGRFHDSHGKFRGVGNIGALVNEACNAYFDHC